jgi:hypothetical protein
MPYPGTPGRPIFRKGGAVVAFVGGGLKPYRRPDQFRDATNYHAATLLYHGNASASSSIAAHPHSQTMRVSHLTGFVIGLAIAAYSVQRGCPSFFDSAHLQRLGETMAAR